LLVLEKNNLPKGWVLTTLGNIITRSKDKFNPLKEKDEIFVGLEHIESNTGKIIGRGRSKETKSTKTRFQNGDVLYGKLRPYLNKVCIPNFDGVCSTDILVFSKNNLVESKYLSSFLFTTEFVRFANQNMSGVQHPRISYEKISEYKIPLAPLQEQKRIIAKIEELFSKIDSNIQLLNIIKLQLIKYKKSLFRNLFDSSNVELITNCAEVGTGGTPLRKYPEYFGGIIPWVKTKEVKNSHISETEEKITQLGLENSNAKIFPKNSVVLAMYGEGKNRGRCAILDISASTNQACAVIVCNPEKLFYKYCFYWLQSQYDVVRLKSSGGNQPNLSVRIVKKLKIPFFEISKQKQIVNRIESGLSQMNFLNDSIVQNLEFLSKLKNSILKLAFEGKLVPQDLDDTPIIKSLKRIKMTV